MLKCFKTYNYMLFVQLTAILANMLFTEFLNMSNKKSRSFQFSYSLVSNNRPPPLLINFSIFFTLDILISSYSDPPFIRDQRVTKVLARFWRISHDS